MTHEQPLPARFAEKLRQVIATALANLPADDLAERIDYCRTTGVAGCVAHPEGESIRIEWGGRDLAVIERDLLADDVADLPPGEWISTDVPDIVPPAWSAG